MWAFWGINGGCGPKTIWLFEPHNFTSRAVGYTPLTYTIKQSTNQVVFQYFEGLRQRIFSIFRGATAVFFKGFRHLETFSNKKSCQHDPKATMQNCSKEWCFSQNT